MGNSFREGPHSWGRTVRPVDWNQVSAVCQRLYSNCGILRGLHGGVAVETTVSPAMEEHWYGDDVASPRRLVALRQRGLKAVEPGTSIGFDGQLRLVRRLASG